MLDVQNILKNCEVSKQKAEEVWLPSFSTQAYSVNTDLTGVALGNDLKIEKAH